MDGPDALKQAFLATTYLVDPRPGVLEAALALRVGQPAPGLDALLRAQHTARWAYLTAWNPRGQQAGAEDNARAQARLDKRLGGLGLTTLQGRGVGDGGQWTPEESRLVLGLSRAQAQRLCHEFEQAAYLSGKLGEPVELVMVELDDDGPIKGRACGRCG